MTAAPAHQPEAEPPTHRDERQEPADPDRQLDELAADQAGVVSRRQVRDLGFSDSWLRARIASRRWQRMHRGVYATFTGALPWSSRCWAACLRCGVGSALAGETALRLWTDRPPDGEGRDDPLIVAIESSQRVDDVEGVTLWRVSRLKDHIHPTREPPRLRYDTAVLLTASRARTADQAIATVADACQVRRTTPARLLLTLRGLPPSMRFRGVLHDILDDVATGAYSYLEVQYLRRVERPHGLPTGTRQRRVSQGRQVWFRDVEYVGYFVIAELDGRLGHELFRDRGHDMDRDNAASRRGNETYRIGYRQTIRESCATAQLMVDALRAGGWTGRPRRCGPGCTITC